MAAIAGYETLMRERAEDDEDDEVIEDDDVLDEEMAAEAKAAAKREAYKALAFELLKTRQTAMDARSSSGVELEWRDAEDGYLAIDEVNRANFLERLNQGKTADSKVDREPRALTSVQTIRHRTDSTAAQIGDMLYPTDEKNWEGRLTPDPELDKARKAAKDLAIPANGGGLINGAQGQPEQQMPDNGMLLEHPEKPGQPLTGGDIIDDVYKEAEASCEAMCTVIDDQLNECNYNAEGRSMLEDAAKLGTGILEGPVIINRVSRRWKRVTGPDGKKVSQLEIIEDLRPAVFRVEPWRIYPDPAGGEDPQKGEYIWKQDDMSHKTLRDLMKIRAEDGDPAYNIDEIRACLAEGPQRFATYRPYHTGASSPNGYSSTAYEQNVFEVWTYTGMVTVKMLRDCGCPFIPEDLDDTDALSAVVSICNDRAIKVMVNPMDTGELPFRFFQLGKVRGRPWGVGIPFLLSHPVATLNSGWRMMLDSAGKTLGGQVVMRRGAVTPANGRWEITANKLWFLEEEVDEVKKAFDVFVMPSNIAEYGQIIDRAKQWIDEDAGLTMLDQGQMGAVPDKVGVVNVLQNNRNVNIRRLAKRHDDQITTPLIGGMYDWNMQYHEDEDIKVNLRIWARGSTALLQRDQMGQVMQYLSQKAAHPVFGLYLDPKLILEQELEAARIPKSSVFFSEERIKENEDNARKRMEAEMHGDGGAGAAANATVKAAEIRAMAAEKIAKIEAESEQANLQLQAQNAEANDVREQVINNADILLKEKELELKHAESQDGMKVDLALATLQKKSQDEFAANARSPMAPPAQFGPDK